MKRACRLGLLLLSLGGAGKAQAYCWAEAARQYDIEPELLQAIAAVESGYRAEAMNQDHGRRLPGPSGRRDGWRNDRDPVRRSV